MSWRVDVAYVGEGPTDTAVASRLIQEAGAILGNDYTTSRRGRGKTSLDRRLPGFNHLARQGQVILALRDLDHDSPCAASLRPTLVPNPAPRLCLRIAVRSIETWLLADREEFARAIGVPTSRVSDAPETLDRPKDHIVDLARLSRHGTLRRRLVPEPDSGLRQGPELGTWLSEFALNGWNPTRASESGRSPSLTKALNRLRQVVIASRA